MSRVDMDRSCKQCRAWQFIAVLEPERLTPAARTAMSEHQARCPACRNSAAQLQLVQQAIRPSATSDEIIQETHANIMAGVRGKQAIRPWRQAVRWAGAVAAMVLLGFGIGHFIFGTHDRPSYVVPVPRMTTSATEALTLSTVPSVKSTLAEAFGQAGTAKEAMSLLQRAFDDGESGAADVDFQEILKYCETLVAKWPGTAEELEVRKLISRCYTQLGEQDKAQEAFLSYAEAIGQRDRRNALVRGNDAEEAQAACNKTITSLLTEEVERLCQQLDFIPAMAYCDSLMTMFPGTETEHFAGMTRAQYYLANRNPDYAIAEYEHVVSYEETTEWTPRAYLALPSLYTNIGEHDKAVTSYKEMIERFPDDQFAAGAYCNMGILYMARGDEYYVQAIEAFNTVIKRYPDMDYARVAKQMLAHLNTRAMREWDIQIP